VIFDYIGANVAKRLHIGHMRNCNIGDSLRRILSLKYPNLITDNHWGDWGVNMGILIWGWKNYDHSSFGSETLIEKLTAIYVWANNQKDIVENWDKLVRDEFLKLEQKDEENYKLWQEFITTTKKDLQQDLDLLNVPPLQLEQGESFYEADMAWLTSFLDKYNIWKSEDKARFFDFNELADKWQGLTPEQTKFIANLGRSYLISSSGYTSYCYRDVGARLQWARDHGAELMLSVTDKTQKHNFDQAFTIISYLATLPEFQEELSNYLTNNQPLHLGLVSTKSCEGIIASLQLSNMKHIGYGYLKLSEGKMSTRKGNVIPLRDLFSQVQSSALEVLSQKAMDKNIELAELQQRAKKVTVAALKWNDLKQFFEQDIIFDINQVLKFEGNTGVYQLYTYARLNSVRSKMSAVELSKNHPQEGRHSQVEEVLSANHNLLPSEKLILQQLWSVSEVLEQVCTKMEAHLLCNYLYEVCNNLNKWYNDTPILKDTERAVVLALFLDKVLATLAFCLDLLGIEVLESM
jgi:arginyl-tRNA synthetase